MASAKAWVRLTQGLIDAVLSHVEQMDGDAQKLVKFCWFDLKVNHVTLGHALCGRLTPKPVADKIIDWYAKQRTEVKP